MKVTVRKAAVDDTREILRMMGDFADHLGLREYLSVSEKSLFDAAFGPGAFVRIIVASEAGRLIGYAIYYPHFSSFRGERGFFLEDIYVDENYRGRGVGIRLLKVIVREAASHGFNRIDFHVLRENDRAIGFYRKIGAEANEDDIHFKFAGDAFAELAGNEADER